MKIHIVQKGDTLWKIAKKYGVNFEELKKMNTQLSNPDMIMPGMKIKVPGTGGTIKKEAPIGGMKETKVNMGAKKEMPKKEEQIPSVVEAPKEMPVKPPAAALPKEEVKKELPQAEIPKEVPKKPYIPKMPQPVMPEIDINNYYMMNMANLVQQPQLPPKPVNILPEAKPEPVKPPKPANILPEAKPEPVKPIKSFETESPESVESESSVHIQQGGYYQPMYPYFPNCLYPVSPVMPGTGFGAGPEQQMPYPQVQGAQMPMHQMPMHQMPMHQMPMHQMPMHQMPHHGLAGVESNGFEESSSFMPMHHQAAQMPAPVMGAEDMGHYQMPMHQMPHQPAYTAPAVQPSHGYQPYPCPPYPTQLMPVSPVMPGSGFCGPMPYGYPQMGAMPQVQGAMEESPGMAQMPLMPTEHQMPLPTQSQMPLMPNVVKGAETDCGCGGGFQPMNPMGYGSGFEAGPGYGMGEGFPPSMYGAPYGQPMGFAQPQYMNPYGYGPMGGQAFEMPRDFEESSEIEG